MRVAATVTAGLLLVSTQGCTLIGLGVGSAIPDEHAVTVAQLVRRDFEPEATVIAVRRDGTDVRGQLYSIRDGILSMETEQGKASVKLDEARLRVRTGSYALEGALLGAAVDVAIVVTGLLLAFAISSHSQ